MVGIYLLCAGNIPDADAWAATCWEATRAAEVKPNGEKKCRVSVTFRKVRVDTGPVVKGCRPNSSNFSFPDHAHEMFNAARTEYKPRGVTNIYPFIEYSAVFLIAILKEFGIPSLWLCMGLNGLHAFLNRKLSRNNRYQVTTGIKSHSKL